MKNNGPFTIHRCDKDSTLLGRANTLKEAVAMAVAQLDPLSTLDNYIMSGSRIVCFSDGVVPEETPEPAWMRAGSVLFGREME